MFFLRSIRGTNKTICLTVFSSWHCLATSVIITSQWEGEQITGQIRGRRGTERHHVVAHETGHLTGGPAPRWKWIPRSCGDLWKIFPAVEVKSVAVQSCIVSITAASRTPLISSVTDYIHTAAGQNNWSWGQKDHSLDSSNALHDPGRRPVRPLSPASSPLLPPVQASAIYKTLLQLYLLYVNL